MQVDLGSSLDHEFAGYLLIRSDCDGAVWGDAGPAYHNLVAGGGVSFQEFGNRVPTFPVFRMRHYEFKSTTTGLDPIAGLDGFDVGSGLALLPDEYAYAQYYAACGKDVAKPAEQDPKDREDK